MTTIRREELPPDTVVQMWEEDGETIIVVNSTLPPDRQRAAVRAALRDAARKRRGLAVLPIGAILTVEQLKRALHAHPIATAAAASLAATTAVVTTLSPPQQPLEPDEPARPTTTLPQRSSSTTARRPAPPGTRPATAPQPSRISPAHRAVSATAGPASATRNLNAQHTSRATPTVNIVNVIRPPAPRPSPGRSPQPPTATAVRPDERPPPGGDQTVTTPASGCAGVGLEVTVGPGVGVDVCVLG